MRRKALFVFSTKNTHTHTHTHSLTHTHTRSHSLTLTLTVEFNQRGRLYAQGPAAAVEVEELVFFARLETRKGVITFCDAVERLLRGESGEASLATQDAVLAKLKQVTFLGRGAMAGPVQVECIELTHSLKAPGFNP